MTIPFVASWLASTVLSLGAFWLLFRVVLRQEQCYGYNRVLLLLAPVTAGLLPLLPRSELVSWLPVTTVVNWSAPASPTVALPALQLAAGEAAVWPGWHWLLGAYLLGVAVGLGRLAYQAWHLRRMARQLPCEPRPGYVLAYTGGQLPTSSFGRTVFWNEAAELTAAEATTVLDHELAHVRQGHTYDVLWLEVWRAVLWVNPFSYLLLGSLRLTHELLADREAAQASARPTATASYVALLARLTARRLVGGSYSPLLQPFTFSFTLTRIAMLQSKIPVRRWKQWLALPLVAGLCVIVGQPASAQTAPPPPPPPPKVMAEQHAVQTTDTGEKVYTYVDEMPQPPGGGGSAAIIKQIQDNFVSPTGAHKEGRVFANFIVKADGSVGDTKIIKGLTPAYDEAVLAAIRKLPRFTPGKQSGRAVAVSFTVPMMFVDK
jgi:TonB family protein